MNINKCLHCKKEIPNNQKYCSNKCYTQSGAASKAGANKGYNEKKIINQITKTIGKKTMTPGAIGKKLGIHNTTIEKYIKKAEQQKKITTQTIHTGTTKITICTTNKRARK